MCWRGGPASVGLCIPELLSDVLDVRIEPGRAFGFGTDLDGIAGGSPAMDGTIKSPVRVGSL